MLPMLYSWCAGTGCEHTVGTAAKAAVCKVVVLGDRTTFLFYIYSDTVASDEARWVWAKSGARHDIGKILCLWFDICLSRTCGSALF